MRTLRPTRDAAIPPTSPARALAVALLATCPLLPSAVAQTLPRHIGVDDFRVSFMGGVDQSAADYDSQRRVATREPAIALDRSGRQGLIVWTGDDQGFWDAFVRPFDVVRGVATGSQIALTGGTGVAGSPLRTPALACGREHYLVDSEVCMVAWIEEFDATQCDLRAVAVDHRTGGPRLDPFVVDTIPCDELGELLLTWEPSGGSVVGTFELQYYQDSCAPSPGNPNDLLCLHHKRSLGLITSTLFGVPLVTPEYFLGARVTFEQRDAIGRGSSRVALNTGSPSSLQKVYTVSEDDAPRRIFADVPECCGVPMSNAGDAYRPDIAYDPIHDRYLIVWQVSGVGSTTAGEFEIWGQLMELSPSGVPNEVGDDFRISFVEDPGDPERDAYSPRVAFEDATQQFLVTWWSDDDRSFLANNEFEIFLQRVDLNGGLVGGAFRVSHIGIDYLGDETGNPSYDGAYPAIVAQGGLATVAFWGRNQMSPINIGGETWSDREIWAQSIEIGPLFADDFEEGGTSAWSSATP